jgi:DNA-binding transcriptional regulator YiaG
VQVHVSSPVGVKRMSSGRPAPWLMHLGKEEKTMKEIMMKRNIPTIDMISTGQMIVRLRKAAGMSVKDLQMIFGFSTPQAIYKWQQGVAMPTIDNLVVLSVVFGVAIDDIIVIDKTDIGERIA